MIHWTYQALRPCFTVLVEFFWGEAVWGATLALRRLRWVRACVSMSTVVASIIVIWAISDYQLADGNDHKDNYSYYEGKVLEEQLKETRRRIEEQDRDIKKLLLEANTSTLLAVRMQEQINQMERLLSAGVKVLGAVVLMVAGNLVNSVLQIRVRKEAAKIGGRRGD